MSPFLIYNNSNDVQYILEEIATQSSMNARSSKWQEWNVADSYARYVMDSIYQDNIDENLNGI